MTVDPKLPKEVQYWEQKFDECVAIRKTFEEQWYLNMAFYFGRQWAIWQKAGAINRLIEPAVPRNRVRLISNKCKPIIRRELTKLTREEPHFYVVPNTTEPTDVAAARVGESIADYSLRVGKYNKTRRRATFWSLLCGSGFIKTTCSEADTPIEYAAVPAFHIYAPYMQEEELEDQPFLILAKAVDPEVIFQTYGIEVKPNVTVNANALEQKFFSSLGMKNTTQDNNLVYMKEIWVKPCRKYEKGALLVLANGKIVYRYDGTEAEKFEEGEGPITNFVLGASDEQPVFQSDYPYEHGQFPFQKIDHIPSGRFYGDSVLVDIIPLQKEYNKSRSQIVESKNRTSKPQVVYDKGSLDPTKITSEAGLLIPINPGFNRPTPMEYKGLDAWVINDQDRTLADIDETVMQSAIAKGKPPPGIEAASAIAYLQEENDSSLYHTVASIEDATETVGKQTLQLIQQFWSDDYMIKVVSKNSATDVALFNISDVKNNTDLRIEAGSMAPKSRAGKQAFITGLMKDGLIPPEKGLKYLELNETSRLYEELQVDSRQAQRENIKMALTEYPMQMPGEIDPATAEMDPATGQPIEGTGQPYVDPQTGGPLEYPMGGMPVNEFDDHPIHIQEHGIFMKSEQYELLDEQKQQVFLMHYAEHRGAHQSQMMAMQPQPEQGAPPSGE